jgi:hypothetical protein
MIKTRSYARTLKTRLDAIRNEPLPPDDELPEFTEKQRSRIEAFACRGTTAGGRASFLLPVSPGKGKKIVLCALRGSVVMGFSPISLAKVPAPKIYA